ncbi:MAG: ABC transporter ATP-binding protein [Spirochaetaceae bacterium]|jgi:iron complex transport system ATP-binding protein|nr:ABC transporter ATP-binding protein [Spirochaetaceae bacterium]
MSLLAAEGLFFSYGVRRRGFPKASESAADFALQDITFSVEGGEHIALVGPNGSGKSTLFQLLSGYTSPDRGRVLLDGQDILSYPLIERAKRLALIPQGSRTDFPYTGLEMTLMGLYPHQSRFAPADDAQIARAQELMEETGVWGFASRPVTELSGGQVQSLLLARGLLQILPDRNEAQPPALLLLDEAMSELDIAARLGMMKLLSRYTADRNIGVIGIQHDLHTAYRFADRVIALSRGRIAADGSPESVCTPDFFAQVFHVKAEPIPGKGFFFKDVI